MASARLTARRVRRSSPSLTSPKVACAHVFGDITALHSSISLSFRFTLLSQFYHFFTRTMWEQVSPAPHPPLVPTLPHSVVKIHQGDCSNGQVQFVQIEPCLNFIIG